ncbi:MAG: hypothetical protein VXZ51_01875 [Actinomycetota bacterium]|nr:hypothetical protein [Actinomycetota bacterium]
MRFTPTTDSSDLQSPIGSNDLGSLFSFMARRYYAESVFPEATKKIDIWNDKYFFGKIDEFGNAIYPSETNLKQIIAPDTRESIFAVDFVADSFSDLQKTFKDAIMQGKISADTAHNVLKPKGAWYSATQGYEDWMGIMYDVLFTKYFIRSVERKILTFHDFLVEAINLFVRIGYDIPVTKTGYILSKYNSPRMSGLVVEIQNEPRDVDELKSNLIKDTEFDFFQRAAMNHGFLVNKNAPWVLVADINSKVMRDYQDSYGIAGSTDIFETYYYKSYTFDIDLLKRILTSYWNSFVGAYPDPTQFCTGKPTARGNLFRSGAPESKTKTWIMSRKPVRKEYVDRNYPFSFWLRQYFRIRLSEMGTSLDTLAFERLIREANQVRHAMDDKSALIFLNKYLTDIKQKDNLFIGAHKYDLVRRKRIESPPAERALSGLGPTIY